MLSRLLRTAALATGFVAAYVLFDWLSYVQPVLKLGISPWSPHAGLALGLLLVRGTRWAPLVAVAALLAELLLRGHVAGPLPQAVSSVVIALGYAAAARLLRSRLDGPIQDPIRAAWLLGVALAASLAVAAGYALTYFAAGLLPGRALVPGIARYWVGDMNGVITLVPLLLLLPRWRAGLAAVRARLPELFAQVLVAAVTLWLIVALPGSEEARFFYPLFVPVIWIALRWGVPGAALATLGIQAGFMLLVQDRLDFLPLVDIQFLMVTLGVTGVMLGAAVTERRRALDRVAAQEAEQRALLATAPDAVLSLDLAGHIRSANPAAQRMFAPAGGLLTGLPLARLLPGLSLAGGEGRSSQPARRLDGSTFPTDLAWAPLGAPAAAGRILIVRDATERHAAEARLRERDTALARSMRFAVAGELASALTHELKQPIAALVSYLQAAQMLVSPQGPADPRLPETLGKATDQAMRAAGVLGRLRDFYQGGTPRAAAVDVAGLLDGVCAAFADRMRRDGIELDLRVPPGLPPAQCDRVQLEMVLHNLLGNAIEAVSGQPPGGRRLSVAADRENAGLRLEVDDSGPGLAGEVRSRLFEPFVTTKPDGMGLGLAISRSLLQAQAGDLRHATGRLGGACFIIKLPATA